MRRLSPHHEGLRLSHRSQEPACPLGWSQRLLASAGASHTSQSVSTPRRRAVSSSRSLSTSARARAALLRPPRPHPHVRPHTPKGPCAACTHITNFTGLVPCGKYTHAHWASSIGAYMTFCTRDAVLRTFGDGVARSSPVSYFLDLLERVSGAKFHILKKNGDCRRGILHEDLNLMRFTL